MHAEFPAFLFEWPLQIVARLLGNLLFDWPGYLACVVVRPDCAARHELVSALSLGFWACVAVVAWLQYRRRSGAA